MTQLTRRVLIFGAAALAACAPVQETRAPVKIVPEPVPTITPRPGATLPEINPDPPPPLARGPQLYSIYLVRHGEKVLDGSKDPSLTVEGGQRSRDLDAALKSYPLDVVWSTDYRRTRGTAATPARYRAVSVKMYKPNNLENFAQKLRNKAQNALVVGHSNTTPQLAELLGADPGPPIQEADEYDRLYIIDVGTNWTDSRIERFGVLSGYQ